MEGIVYVVFGYFSTLLIATLTFGLIVTAYDRLQKRELEGWLQSLREQVHSIGLITQKSQNLWPDFRKT